jgi:hypothetical protein
LGSTGGKKSTVTVHFVSVALSTMVTVVVGPTALWASRDRDEATNSTFFSTEGLASEPSSTQLSSILAQYSFIPTSRLDPLSQTPKTRVVSEADLFVATRVRKGSSAHWLMHRCRLGWDGIHRG